MATAVSYAPASPTGLYGATKAWITSFTRTLETELKGSGVQILGFSPGMMTTDMLTSPNVVGERGKEFIEVKLFKPWTPLLGLIRVGWENMTKTGKTPEFELHHQEAYQFKNIQKEKNE